MITSTSIVKSDSSMSLPELRDVPEGMSDDDVFLFMTHTFQEINKLQDPPQIEFNDALAWILKIIVTRAEDKAMTLFKCGLVFLNPFVLVNSAILANVLAYPSAEAVNRRLKIWPHAAWDIEERARILVLYDPIADVKSWVAKQPPPDSVVFRISVFRPMEQIQQRVPELNDIPAAQYKYPMQVNIDRVWRRRLEVQRVANTRPFVWTFDTEPAVTIDFVD